ncbi:MAG TPA: hypothetical protein VMV27_09805 [Candidatus Binataceae bacterium]|nr:hypothetical protein [Candidatus Binataceae bacterium]
MPCCAFAAFIISQIVLGYGAIKRLWLNSADSLDEAPSNPATEWRLIAGAPALAAGANRRFGVRTLVLAASIEILLALGALYGYRLHAHHHHHDLASIAGAPASVHVR